MFGLLGRQLCLVVESEKLLLGSGQLGHLLAQRQTLDFDRGLLDPQGGGLLGVALRQLLATATQVLLLNQQTKVPLRSGAQLEILQLRLVALVALGLLGLQAQGAQTCLNLSNDV